MNTPSSREAAIFNAARRLPVGQRPAYLDEMCAGDALLRERVEELLKANDAAGDFLKELASGTGDAEAPPGPSGTIRVPSDLFEKPGDRIGRYKLLERVGEGGCGVVYVAEQTEPVRRRVALKVIKLGMDTKAVVARFEAERQALAMMDHPNIAKVLDAGTTDTGRPYFVMELVRGIRLTDYCDQNQLPTKERLDLFIKVCQAIQHAHQKGIIHRDVKPSNILVTLHDGVPVPKVIDFGIAKATEGRLTDATVYTQLHQFIGTPAYMSPEQAEMSGLDIDTRSDIYSLGVLLYELLVGSTPFDAKELMASGIDAMRKTIREKEPVRPSTRFATLQGEELTTTARRRSCEVPKLVHLLKGDLDWIVMKCLEKDRARRYETANGLAADLRRHLANEPVVARPPSMVYRFQKLARRNRVAFAAGTAVAVALIIGLIVSTWSLVKEEQARRRAVAAEKTQAALRQDAESARQQAQAEAKRAEGSASELRTTLEAADFGEANRLINAREYSDAVPYLSRILSADPDNVAARSQLSTLLTYHSWPVPALSLKHGDGVHSAQFSPDGTRIVTASADNTARVWDAQTGNPLTEPLKHAGAVASAQFSPDGKRVLTLSWDSGNNTTQIWDAQDGRRLSQSSRFGSNVVRAKFSPDGDRVVTESDDDNSARVWDAQTGRPLTEPLHHQDHVMSAEFSPDGKRIVTASRDYTARVWDAQTGQPLGEPMKHRNWVTYAQFSPDGKRIVTASIEFGAQVWDAQTCQPAGEPLKHQNIQVFYAEFSPDGKRVVTASNDKTARVWDAQTGLPLTEPFKHPSEVYSAQFSPDGKRIVTRSADGAAQVWDAQTGRPLMKPLRHGSFVLDTRFSPNGQRIVTASSSDSSAWVWDAPLGRALPVSLNDASFICQFSPEGKRIVTISKDGIRVCDAQTSEPLTPPFDPEGAYDVEFSPDGKRVATASESGTARVWDARTGEPVTPPLKHENRVYSAQFSPDGTRLVTASWDRTARIWDAQTGQQLNDPLRHGDYVNSAQFSPDGKRVVTASWDNTAQIWDAQTSKPLTEPLKHKFRVNFAQFSPDGKRVVTASDDSTARVWDAQSGQPLTEPLKHPSTVWRAQFSPDSKRIVTASWDKTARVWDAQSGQPLTGPLKHDSEVISAQFSPDGKRIVTRFATTEHAIFAPFPFSPDGGRIATTVGVARLWDAWTGQPLTEPLRFADELAGPQSNADGPRPESAWSHENVVHVWDVGFIPSKLPDWLLPLAEAVSGRRLNKAGSLEETSVDRAKTIAQIRQDLKNQPDNGDGVMWGRWLLSDPASRSISPLSAMTVSTYIEDRIKEQSKESLLEAEQLAYGNTELLQRISDVQARLARIVILSSNGTSHARSGQWTNAIGDFSELIRLDPNEQDYYHSMSALLARSGDVDGYRWHCAKILAVFGATNHPVFAERSAKDCLILPVAGIDLNAVARLADTAIKNGESHSYFAYFEFAKGLAEYRQGHFESAIEWMRKVLVEGSADYRDAETFLVLGMAQQRSGRLAEARAALAKSREIIETKFPKLESGDIGDYWVDWIIVDALLKEAKELIEEPRASSK